MKASTKRLVLIGVLALFVLMILTSSMYTVSERELAVVVQFGQPVASRTEPGLYFKIPMVQEVVRLPRTLQYWSGVDDRLIDVPTADGKKIEVTPWAVWRINDPKQFVQVLRNVPNAEARVQTIVRSSVRDVITSHDLSELVRSSNRELTYSFQQEPIDEDGEAIPELEGTPTTPQAPEAKETIRLGRQKLVEEMKELVQRRLNQSDDGQPGGRGIELVDVGISRIDFVKQVREAAFDRLIAFMDSIASRYLNEGERRKQEILNRTQAEIQKIEGEGMEESNRIRGKVDAEIIEKYAAAINQTGDFYNFIRTLEAYKEALTSGSRLILTTDSEFLTLLKKAGEAKTPAKEPEKSKESDTAASPE
jgi:membrane protease subunit HflC